MKKKNFTESPEQLALRKEKERKELLRWQKEQQKPKNKGYLWYTMVILAMIYVVDEITEPTGPPAPPAPAPPFPCP